MLTRPELVLWALEEGPAALLARHMGQMPSYLDLSFISFNSVILDIQNFTILSFRLSNVFYFGVLNDITSFIPLLDSSLVDYKIQLRFQLFVVVFFTFFFHFVLCGGEATYTPHSMFMKVKEQVV